MEMGVFMLVRAGLFGVGSFFIVLLSWRSLRNPRSHGFYRFFAFEAILILLVLNIPFWIRDPLSPLQLVSWLLLVLSGLFVVQGFYLLHRLGGHEAREDSEETFNFEETATLVRAGIYGYIRHPLYSSLLLLAWGAYLKHISLLGTIAVLCATAALIATAKIEEGENLSSFGAEYRSYIEETKMFLPYLF